jgi:hypothetical protein
MAKQTREELFASIREALAAGVRDFLTEFRAAWPGETMYGFLFELPCEGTHAHAAAATEEGLIRVADRYASRGYRAKTGDTPTVLRTWLRWAGPEDGWYQGNDTNAFLRASQLLDDAFAAGFMKSFDGQLNDLALAALRDLDALGEFGSGADRERVVLGMCYIGGDNSDEEFLGWAKRVNPPAVMKRLRRELTESGAAGELSSRSRS